jgi:predicted flap endonuclease-1-like 5' DNA nuclease
MQSEKVRILVDGRYSGPDLKAIRAVAGDEIEVLGGLYADSLFDSEFAEPIKAEKETEETADETPEVEPIPVSDVKGIGKATAKRLAKAGIETAQALVEADVAKLAEKAGLPVEKITTWKETAVELIGGE